MGSGSMADQWEAGFVGAFAAYRGMDGMEITVGWAGPCSTSFC